MLTTPQLRDFYLTCRMKRVESALAIVLPFLDEYLPVLAAGTPFRLLAHNGEINTVRGTRTGCVPQVPDPFRPSATSARPADLRPHGSDTDASTRPWSCSTSPDVPSRTR